VNTAVQFSTCGKNGSNRDPLLVQMSVFSSSSFLSKKNCSLSRLAISTFLFFPHFTQNLGTGYAI